jgi:quercetin dioxygenase-like cupin family protein
LWPCSRTAACKSNFTRRAASTEGRGEYVCEGVRQNFEPGDFLFAAAGESHWFERFSDDFAVWVLFYGPEGGESDETQ